MEREEVMWWQQSKALWLKESDQNTRFFHSKASHRRQRNTINRLKNATGEWKEDVQLSHVIIEHFNELFLAPTEIEYADFLDSVLGRTST